MSPAATIAGPSDAELDDVRRIVRAVVHRSFGGVPMHLADFDDLEQQALMTVIRRWDRWHDDGMKRSVWIWTTANGALIDYHRQLTKVRAGRRTNPQPLRSLDEPVLDDEGSVITLGDTLEHQVEEDHTSDTAGQLETLAGMVARLPDRLQLVLELHYARDMTLAAIGERMGVGESRVCQLKRQALTLLAADADAGVLRS